MLVEVSGIIVAQLGSIVARLEKQFEGLGLSKIVTRLG